jgi:hypothetical protein
MFQPDRLPAGAYERRLPASGFAEVLLERPAAVASAAGGLRASEMVVARHWPSGTTPLATRAAGGLRQPVVTSWPVGLGRFVFSGALDAWRYRADDEVAFERFWQAVMANLAAAAPGSLAVEIEPAVAAPGDHVRVIARVRGGLAPDSADGTITISAVLLLEGGARHSVRLWPSAGEGMFEGRLEAHLPGRHLIEAAAGARTAAAPMLVTPGARQPRGLDRAALERFARATGGVVVGADDRGSLEAHLRARAETVEAVARPTRSAWWFLAGFAALCGEWTLRRRRGLP